MSSSLYEIDSHLASFVHFPMHWNKESPFCEEKNSEFFTFGVFINLVNSTPSAVKNRRCIVIRIRMTLNEMFEKFTPSKIIFTSQSSCRLSCYESAGKCDVCGALVLEYQIINIKIYNNMSLGTASNRSYMFTYICF